MAISEFPEDTDVSRLVDRRMALTREWDTLVEQVRALPGFEDFLRPPPLEKLLPASANGPVAVINVSQWRCDALLVVDGAVRTCPLPDLTAADVEQKTLAYLAALELTGQRRAAWRQAGEQDDETKAAFTEAEEHAEAMLRAILRWLWRTVTEPVLTALGFVSTPSGPPVPRNGGKSAWPRLWWCPTGLLTLLPLHAAGDHLADGPDRPTVLDRVVSSYTPTLRALIQAREQLPDAPPSRLLVVTVPEADGEEPLPGVEQEREMLIRRFDGRCTPLHGSDATKEQVIAQLPQHRWVHFSCHGYQLLNDPSRGGVRLADETLTIAELSAREQQGEFAFLSACKTATGGTDLADEAITLAAALHYTGYRHVIGTLWTVFTDSATEVAAAVYAQPFDPAAAVYRLHEVLSTMREREPLTVWTPFSHLGP
ncbi:CHAT domain-containing protein [Actinoplanes derwentensis]|uniref:CHAT domain-containing protein n=1 Tax=Actinoplanes derwentensis TaxID=113562 RepID=UPI0012FD1955|nr:CHAT domain-containing protein [Actinoplanes derwentensis]